MRAIVTGPRRDGGSVSYRDQIVRVSDLVLSGIEIRAAVFESCVVVGPAMICLVDRCRLVECGFESDLEAILWPTDRAHVEGVIGCWDTTFRRCRFQQVGLVYPTRLDVQIRAGFGPAPGS